MIPRIIPIERKITDIQKLSLLEMKINPAITLNKSTGEKKIAIQYAISTSL